MVFHWSLSDSKSPQVSSTLLSILAVLSNAISWIVSTRSPTYKSSGPFNNPLVIVPKAPITICTIVTFMFHSLFNSLARSRFLYFFSHSFSFILWSAGTAKSTILQILFFFVDYYKVWFSGRDKVITNVSWWFFIGVWVIAILLKFPGLFSVFWPISTILLLGLSAYFQVLPFLHQSLGNCTKSINYNWYHRRSHVP